MAAAVPWEGIRKEVCICPWAARVWNIFHQCLYFPYFSHFPNTWDPRSGRAFCICSRWEIQCVHPVANTLHVKDIQLRGEQLQLHQKHQNTLCCRQAPPINCKGVMSYIVSERWGQTYVSRLSYSTHVVRGLVGLETMSTWGEKWHSIWSLCHFM